MRSKSAQVPRGASGNEAVLQRPPVLITESADEFDHLRRALEREIQPRGIVEHMYLSDFVSIIWEILRLRRCKTVIVNTAYRSALQELLKQFLKKPGHIAMLMHTEAETLALRWFTDPTANKEVSDVLRPFQLDESAIEAEALRRSSVDLEKVDKMLTSLEGRRNKLLRCIFEYRVNLANRLRESANRILDGDVHRLEHASGKKSAP